MLEHRDVEARIVEDLGDRRVGEQLDQVRRFLEVGGNLHHVGTAIAGRQLHHAEPVAARIQPHRFGVDRHLPRVAREVGQVAPMQSNGHGWVLVAKIPAKRRPP
jgi:hypothetical protein